MCSSYWNKHNLRIPFILRIKLSLPLETAQTILLCPLTLFKPCYRENVLGKPILSLISTFITTHLMIQTGHIRLCAVPNQALFFFPKEKWASSRAEHKSLSASTQQCVPSAWLHLARKIIEVFCLPGWMSNQFKINTCTFEFSCENTCQYNYRFTFCKYTGRAAWL